MWSLHVCGGSSPSISPLTDTLSLFGDSTLFTVVSVSTDKYLLIKIFKLLWKYSPLWYLEDLCCTIKWSDSKTWLCPLYYCAPILFTSKGMMSYIYSNIIMALFIAIRATVWYIENAPLKEHRNDDKSTLQKKAKPPIWSAMTLTWTVTSCGKTERSFGEKGWEFIYSGMLPSRLSYRLHCERPCFATQQGWK